LPLESGVGHHIASFGRGDFFGDMAFLDHQERSADAVAERDTDLFILSHSEFDKLAKDNPHVGAVFYQNIARVLAIRLRHTDSELRALEEA
jgi:SulP family sulfate permease